MDKMNRFPIQLTHVLAPLLLLIIAIISFLLNNLINDYFVYHRGFIIEGQYWRVITGHLFHTNFAHLILNTLAIVLLWALHGRFYSIKTYSLLFIFSSLMISAAIFTFSPEMNQYVGLSGVLHAFFVWGALKDIQYSDKTGYLLLVGVVIKVAHEQFFGASDDIASLINASVAIEAHLWGVVSGIIFFTLAVQFKKDDTHVKDKTLKDHR